LVAAMVATTLLAASTLKLQWLHDQGTILQIASLTNGSNRQYSPFVCKSL